MLCKLPLCKPGGAHAIDDNIRDPDDRNRMREESPAPICERGALQVCPCIGGGEGVQACADGQQGWDECQCSPDDGPGGAAGSGGSAGSGGRLDPAVQPALVVTLVQAVTVA